MKAPAIERQVDNLSVIDHLNQVTGFGIEQWGFSRYLQLSTCSLEADGEVHASRLANRQLDSISNTDLKSGGGGTDTVEARIQRSHHVIATRVARHGLGYIGSRVGNHDARPWDGQVLWVVHISHNAARLKLRQRC